MNQKNKRLLEIDFLRGVAILLVLFRHQDLTKYTTNMGWIGVDLFFVLSGFLVSGLLFKEYKKFGKIDAVRFLIRRGFKIYPVYYLTYGLYLILIIKNNKLDIEKLFYDLTFLQNYFNEWGYAYGASWSLAIEEHFYFGLTFIIWLGLKIKIINFQDNVRKNKFLLAIILLIIISIILKFHSNYFNSENNVLNFTMTHLRIDSLLVGVLIAYFYHFKFNLIKQFTTKYKYLLLLFFVITLTWTPFIEPISSSFVKTFGFIMLYLSFGSLLLIFLFTNNMESYINKYLPNPLNKIIYNIGYCSYSIYIIHMLINSVIYSLFVNLNIIDYKALHFITSLLLSIIAGMLLTFKVENYFLTLRDKIYPSKAKFI